MVSLSHPKSPLSSLHIFSNMNKSSSPSSSSSSSSSTPSSLTTMKVKTLIHNLIFSHICRVIRALSKAKSIFLEIFKDNNQLMYLKQNKNSKKRNKYRNKILFGSFRLHYNWCSSSSHVLPIIPPSNSPTILEGFNTPTKNNTTSHDVFYDSTWNSAYDVINHHHDHDRHMKNDNVRAGNHNGGDATRKEEEDDDDEVEGQLSSYLQWLEEKGRKINENIKNEKEEVINVENEIDKLADMFIANCHEKFRLEKIESYRRYQELLARSL